MLSQDIVKPFCCIKVFKGLNVRHLTKTVTMLSSLDDIRINKDTSPLEQLAEQITLSDNVSVIPFPTEGKSTVDYFNANYREWTWHGICTDYGLKVFFTEYRHENGIISWLDSKRSMACRLITPMDVVLGKETKDEGYVYMTGESNATSTIRYLADLVNLFQPPVELPAHREHLSYSLCNFFNNVPDCADLISTVFDGNVPVVWNTFELCEENVSPGSWVANEELCRLTNHYKSLPISPRVNSANYSETINKLYMVMSEHIQWVLNKSAS